MRDQAATIVTAARRAGRFGAVVTAMVTPFDGDGRVDLDGATALARHLADHGSDALVVTGTTGEGPTLTDAERIDLWSAVSGAVTVPVIAGSGTNDTAHSVELTRAATAAGAAGILAVTPYYNRPSQSGIEAHFAAVAAATTLPVMLYDIPIRTGRKIDARDDAAPDALVLQRRRREGRRPATRPAPRGSWPRPGQASTATAVTTR